MFEALKRAARTCAIIRVWDYPNKPDLAKVVPIRIGTLLAKFWNRPSGHCLPVAEAITVPDENLHSQQQQLDPLQQHKDRA